MNLCTHCLSECSSAGEFARQNVICLGDMLTDNPGKITEAIEEGCRLIEKAIVCFYDRVFTCNTRVLDSITTKCHDSLVGILRQGKRLSKYSLQRL